MPTALRDVRFQGQSGKHLLVLSFSGFDPQQKAVRSSRALFLSRCRGESNNRLFFQYRRTRRPGLTQNCAKLSMTWSWGMPNEDTYNWRSDFRRETNGVVTRDSRGMRRHILFFSLGTANHESAHDRLVAE
jgi:hypothetical protein